MSMWITFFLSFVEGITEFLPISSTGHLIVLSSLFQLEKDQFVVQFNIIIQFGAILSVLFLYWRRFLPNWEFYKKLAVAFIPTAIIGLLIKNKIDVLLESVEVVAWALIVGGIILLFIDNKKSRFFQNSKSLDELTYKQALFVGLMQCFAFVPGVSRSAATIIGGRLTGLNAKAATEFSFFLAVPTLTGAALLKTLKIIPAIEPHQIQTLLIGIVLSFLFALVSIKTFIAFVSKGAFRWFGIYRIILGISILIFLV